MRSSTPVRSSPAGEKHPGESEEERELAKDLGIGHFNFKSGNYRGAELRFRHALNYKPDQPQATFKVAQSLNTREKLMKPRRSEEAYLRIQPNGP